MKAIDRFYDIGVSLTSGAMLATAGGIIWLFRLAITNQAQIRAIVKSLELRDEARNTQRQEDREALSTLTTKVETFHADIVDKLMETRHDSR